MKDGSNKEQDIIINISLYKEFIDKFKEKIKDIYVIPKIIIFSKNKDKLINEKINNSFYNLGGIKTSFDEIIQFIINPVKIKRNLEEENQLTFEYIDCKEKLVLPMFFKSMIELTPKDNIDNFTELIYNKYSKNEDVHELLNTIKSISDIPIELLSKYYTRLYTLESNFYSDLNKDLRYNKKENYLPFIKILYEGAKLKSLPLASDKKLYRGTIISNNEIDLIKSYLNKKIENLPGAIVFSKSFLSFSKNIESAMAFINKENKNNNLSKAFLELENDNNISYDLSTHADIENISKYPNEREVLFFPFSSFEIKEIKELYMNNEKIYIIKLLYLGKYLKKILKIWKIFCQILNLKNKYLKWV